MASLQTSSVFSGGGKRVECQELIFLKTSLADSNVLVGLRNREMGNTEPQDSLLCHFLFSTYLYSLGDHPELQP